MSPTQKTRRRAPKILVLFLGAACFFGLPGSGSRADAGVLLSEFMAVNDSTLLDEDGDDSDWLEITNSGTEAVNLNGWYLTDDAANLAKWQFPDVTLASGEVRVVFASKKDRRVPGGELHTNFKLSGAGEFLALVEPDGTTIAHQYAPTFPPQYPDISYGVATVGAEIVTLVGPGADASYVVPTGDADDVNNPAASPPWNDPGFDDSAWTATPLGVGYVRGSGEDAYDEFIATDAEVEPLMDGVNTTAYVRVEFTVENPAEVTALTLWMRYDDGFAAYINGGTVPVASANAPDAASLAYNSKSTDSHADGSAVVLEAFPIDLAKVTLVAGTNVLAIHGLNVSLTSSDFLVDCELKATVTPGGGTPEMVYMTTPTPGEPNVGGVTTLGPIFRAVTESAPAVTLPDDTEIVVTAQVDPAGDPVSSVSLHYRRMFEAEGTAPMADDGLAPDLVAGDGIYTGTVPLAGLAPGEMMRWRFEATDSEGVTSRAPLFNDPDNSAEYFGTIALDPTITSETPVVHWFVADPAAADTRSGTRASAWFRDEFYDNFFVRLRGGSTSGFPKKSYKFDFNPHGHFRFDPAFGRAEEINLNQTWSDKAYIRQSLSFEVYDASGSPGSESFLVRLHRNGQFHALSVFVEQPDKRLLKREGLDDAGALYKMFNAVTSGTGGVEKKNRTHEDNSDLVAFVNGVNNNTGEALETFIFDHVDVPRELNYLVGTVLVQSNDNMSKNFYLYRDSDGTGEWFQIPWDTDLTWGRHYMTADTSADDGIWATADYVLGGRSHNVPISPSHPFVGTQALPGNRSWNRLIDKLHSNPRFAEMFRRRLRTVMDEVLAPPLLDDRIAALRSQLTADAAEDLAKWGQFGESQTLAEATGILEGQYLAPRRVHLFTTHLAENEASYPTPETSSAMIPAAQADAPPIVFGDFDANPSGGTQSEEFLELRNPNTFAVDLSGWRVTGGVEHTFRPGTVIEAGGSLYLSPDVAAFRARATSPTGGEGHFVQGDYKGQISARGETMTLLDTDSTAIASLTTPSNPSDAQQYLRITELHYAPPGGTGGEFIELKNIGPTTLDLEGIYFSQGVTFTFGAGVSLAPGEIGILASDPASFPGANILGTYTGGLRNDGEQITLRDATGENILSFSYDGNWFPPALAGGYSIQIEDDAAPWDSWDNPVRWVLSSEIGGSPGVANPTEHSQAYEAWQRNHFTPVEIEDPAFSGPDADANGDGTSNLMKYAMGLDPFTRSSDGMPRVEFAGDRVVFTYQRWKRAADLEYGVEGSADMVSWSPVTAEFAPPVDLGGGIEKVTMDGTPTADHARRFFRLRVTKQ
jgi:hypothetical protein